MYPFGHGVIALFDGPDNLLGVLGLEAQGRRYNLWLPFG
jgi:hypothetical protein